MGFASKHLENLLNMSHLIVKQCQDSYTTAYCDYNLSRSIRELFAPRHLEVKFNGFLREIAKVPLNFWWNHLTQRNMYLPIIQEYPLLLMQSFLFHSFIHPIVLQNVGTLERVYLQETCTTDRLQQKQQKLHSL